MIVVYSAKPHPLRHWIDPPGIITCGNQIVVRPDPSRTADLEIRLGKEWVNKLPVTI